MSLESRITSFEEVKQRFACRWSYPLIAVHRIENRLFERLQHAICVYLS